MANRLQIHTLEIVGGGVGDGSPRAHVGYAVVELHLPGSQGLKEKRGFLKSITAALVDDLGASVSEVGWQDLWQRAALGVAVVASSPTGVDRALERVVTLCERDPRVLVTAMVEQVDVLHGTTD